MPIYTVAYNYTVFDGFKRLAIDAGVGSGRQTSGSEQRRDPV